MKSQSLFQSRRTHRRMNHLLLRAGIFVAAILCTNASSSTGKIGQNGPLPKFPLMGVTSDPFIEFSPMVVGVVCRDGVLLFAVHSIFSKDNAELPLLRDSIGEESCTDNSENRSNNTRVAAFQKDLPRRYRGPFRIHPVDSSCASAMVCSGWRTDCQNLINHIRSIDRREQLEFGHHIGTAPEYGSFLASQASLLMAKFCVSESRRPLSCLGLLASGSCLGLWVVDATGAYRVRAHALGQGSDRMNEILRKVDWTQRDSNGVKDELLRLLYSDSVHDSDDENSSSEIKIPEGSCIEMAVIEKPTRKAPNTMKRLFASL